MYVLKTSRIVKLPAGLKRIIAIFPLAFMYRTVSNDVKVILETEYDVICFFTPSGVKSLFDNMPKFKQNGTVIGAFGNNTSKAVEEAGLKLPLKLHNHRHLPWLQL